MHTTCESGEMNRPLKFRENPRADERRICSLLAEIEPTAYAIMHPETRDKDMDIGVAAGVMAHTFVMIIAELTVERRERNK